MKYPKINTLWKRDEDNKYCIMPGEFSCEEFKAIKKWYVTEKIDGTNIRIIWDGTSVVIRGRTDNAQLPTVLIDYLLNTFKPPLMNEVFPDLKDEEQIILYGEGYGPKIQKGGGAYRKDVSFILFDVLADKWWLKREAVEDISDKLVIDSVPEIGIMEIDDIVDFVRNLPMTQIYDADKDKMSEGVVVRSEPLMLFRNGNPIMFKLKAQDYIKLAKKDGVEHD